LKTFYRSRWWRVALLVTIAWATEALATMGVAAEGESGLRIISNEPDTEVFVDGKDKGKAPFTVDQVTPGEHIVYGRKTGFKSQEQTVRVPAGENAIVSFRLEAAPPQAGLKVQSTIPNAEVFVDGSSLGRAPVDRNDLDPGKHYVTVHREGFTDFKREVFLVENRSVALVADLSATGALRVLSTPLNVYRASPADWTAAKKLTFFVDLNDGEATLPVSAREVAQQIQAQLRQAGLQVSGSAQHADGVLKLATRAGRSNVVATLERDGVTLVDVDAPLPDSERLFAREIAKNALGALYGAPAFWSFVRDRAQAASLQVAVAVPPKPSSEASQEKTSPEILSAPITKMRQPDSYAVVVGIEKYRGAFPEATGAEQDARLFREFAIRTLGVPESHIRLLVGQDASKADLEAVLEEWLPNQPRRSPSNTYFYFSGHGAPDARTGEGYIMPFDGDPAYLKTKALSVKRVYDLLGAVPQSRTIAFIDSCFSGSGGRSVLAPGTRPLITVKSARPNSGSLVALTASTASQVSGPSDGGTHGLFTYQLLRGLSGLADRDGDRTVTLFELETFVKRHVSEDARRANRDQTPELVSTGIEKPGEVIIVDGIVP